VPYPKRNDKTAPVKPVILVIPLKKDIKLERILKSLTLDFFGKGKHKISPEKFFELENCFLLDVRSKEEAGSISIQMEYHLNVESKNIPINEIPDRVNEIPKEKSVAVFCPANVRSAIVYAYLLSKDFSDVRIVDGGYSALTEALKPGKVLKVLQSEQ
jgi:rhodanese-related sulfurtransferase